MSRITRSYYSTPGRMRLNWGRPPLHPRATRMNRRLSNLLRWRPYRNRIATVTGASTPSPLDFATALQDWQKSQGLPANGVLGPATWKKMKPVLNAPEPPAPPPPAADAGGDAPPEPAAAGADSPSSDAASGPGPDDAGAPDGPPPDEPQQGESGYGFRARRRCACARCRAARVTGRPCSCDACRQQQQQEQEFSWVPKLPSWLGGTSPAATPTYPVNRTSKEYIRWYQTGLNRLISAGLVVDGARGPRTRAAVRQFQSQNGLTVDGIVGPQTEAALIRAGAGMPPAASVTPTPSPTPTPTPTGPNAAVDTPLPRTAPGMYSYGVTSRQYGTRQAIQALLSIGQRWAGAFPSGPQIGVGDISFQGGGLMKPHVSHQKGVDADIRLMRNDGVKDGTTYKSPSYSRPLTQQLVDMIRANDVLKVQLILNNDPQITGVKPWPGHDNHLHVRFVEPATSGEFETALSEEFQSRGGRCNCSACRCALSQEELGEMPGAPVVNYPVNRKSSAYVQWYQGALNKILPAILVVDGRLGPKTRAAVLAFQRRSGLKLDGIVGPVTEAALITAGAPLPPRAGAGPGPQPLPPGPLPIPPGPLPVPPLPKVPCGPSPTLSAAERDVLSVTSTLEGGRPFHCAVSATDGISMGSMQWNLAAGTLQNMLAAFERGTSRLASYFGTDTDRLKRLIDRGQTSLKDAVAQATAEKLAARWHDPLSRLCADPFMCGLQQRDIAARLCTTWDNFTSLSLGTVRGLSMCYDIINGDGAGGMARVRARALTDPSWASTPESTKLVNLANFAADRLSKFREERRARRLNLANVRTPYRGAPATPPRSFADQINRTVPGLDRALTIAERTVCRVTGAPARTGEFELGEIGGGSAVNRKSPAYIQWYQGALNKILPAALSVDGRYGPKTRAAVRAFQVRKSLKSDGVVGAQTEAALVRAGAPSPPGGTSPVPPGRQGRTFVTRFTPGENHNHQPTNRWGDIQSDAQRRCLNPSSSEGFVSDCACAIGSPQMVADTVSNTIMQALPLAKVHFNHYFNGGGKNLMVDLANVIRSDSKVRAKLAANIRARPIGHFRVGQSDYDVKDFQFAFGAIDRLDYEADRSAGLVHVWFQDRYEWHPVGFGYTRKSGDDRREDNCVHAAMVELKNSGARDYWMIGDAVIPLSDVTGRGSPGGGGRSDSLEIWSN